LEKTVEAMGQAIDQLEHEYNYKPVKLMGIRTNFELLGSIFTVLVSVGFALGEKIVE